MLRDSNTGSPDYVPPVAPPVNGGISGPGNPADDTDPPAATAKIERLNVVYNPYDTRFPGVKQPTNFGTNVTAWSSEGQAPNLNGIRVEAWYDDGSMKILGAGALATIPAILGEEYVGEVTQLTGPSTGSIVIASGAYVTKAEPKTISVYSRADGGPIAQVQIPGVRGIYFSATGSVGSIVNPRGGQNSRTWTAPYETNASIPTKNAGGVYGNNGVGIRFTGNLNGRAFFEDGVAPTATDFGTVAVQARYFPLVENAATAPAAGYAGLVKGYVAGVESETWEDLGTGGRLTAGHIFDDYYAGFTTTASTATSAKRYAYGLDPDTDNGYLYMLISKGTTHGGSTNRSVYIAVPFGTATYHYIRSVEVVSVDWVNELTPVGATTAQDIGFYREIDLPTSLTAWDELLETRNIKLKVYYDDYPTPVDRGVDFYRRARILQRAGVLGMPDLSDPDEDTYGKLSVGYYSAVLSAARNFPLYGEFPNFNIIQVPIGAFVEGSGELAPTANVPPETLPLTFVNNTNGALNNAQFEAIQNSYDLVGTFSYPGKADVQLVLIPGTAFATDYFRGTPLRVTEPELVTIEMTVPRTATGTAAVYIGEEGEFDAVAYPTNYDGRDTVYR